MISGTASPGSSGRKPSGSHCLSGLWLAPSAGPKSVPWARPVVQTPTNQPPDRSAPQTPLQQFVPPVAQQPEPFKSCKMANYNQTIQSCTAMLTSGNLSGKSLADAYRDRGWAYFLGKQYQAAMNDYDRSIALNPGYPGYFNDRGLIWMALENNDRAMQDYEQAIMLKPQTMRCPTLNRGRIALHQSEAAQRSAGRLCSGDPERDSYACGSAYTKIALPVYERARRLARQLRRRQQDDRARFRTGPSWAMNIARRAYLEVQPVPARDRRFFTKAISHRSQ